MIKMLIIFWPLVSTRDELLRQNYGQQRSLNAKICFTIANTCPYNVSTGKFDKFQASSAPRTTTKFFGLPRITRFAFCIPFLVPPPGFLGHISAARGPFVRFECLNLIYRSRGRNRAVETRHPGNGNKVTEKNAFLGLSCAMCESWLPGDPCCPRTATPRPLRPGCPGKPQSR